MAASSAGVRGVGPRRGADDEPGDAVLDERHEKIVLVRGILPSAEKEVSEIGNHMVEGSLDALKPGAVLSNVALLVGESRVMTGSLCTRWVTTLV